MKPARIFLLASVVFAGPAPTALAAPGAPSEAVIANNCRVVDGDTLRCGRARIRLLGIDAAEMPGHCARGRRCATGDPFAQKAALTQLARGVLRIYPKGDGGYGRTAALVRNSAGRDLSCAMLAAGATYRPQWDRGFSVARICPRLTIAR